jgi:hypothetical protein
MVAISLAIQLLGLILLVMGFRSTNRNMLLGAALLLWFGAGSVEFIQGFLDGWHVGAAHA